MRIIRHLDGRKRLKILKKEKTFYILLCYTLKITLRIDILGIEIKSHINLLKHFMITILSVF